MNCIWDTEGHPGPPNWEGKKQAKPGKEPWGVSPGRQPNTRASCEVGEAHRLRHDAVVPTTSAEPNPLQRA